MLEDFRSHMQNFSRALHFLTVQAPIVIVIVKSVFKMHSSNYILMWCVQNASIYQDEYGGQIEFIQPTDYKAFTWIYQYLTAGGNIVLSYLNTSALYSSEVSCLLAWWEIWGFTFIAQKMKSVMNHLVKKRIKFREVKRVSKYPLTPAWTHRMAIAEHFKKQCSWKQKDLCSDNLLKMSAGRWLHT